MLVALAVVVATGGRSVQPFYDGATDFMPHQTPWVWGLAGAGGTVSAPNGSGKTTLDTTAANSVQEGWLNASLRSLIPGEEPVVTFDLRMVEEQHGNNDRAGTSVIVLCQDKKGVELSFWLDRVWAQNDAPLFTHGEEALVDTALLGHGRGATRRWIVTFTPASYWLAVDGKPVLSGRRRDYTAFSGAFNPYRVPNVLWVGDDTTSARGRVEFGGFWIESGAFPSRLGQLGG